VGKTLVQICIIKSLRKGIHGCKMFRTVQSTNFKCHVSSRLKLSFRTIVSTAETYPLSYPRILLVTFIRQLQICASSTILKYGAIVSSAYTPVHRQKPTQM